MLLLGHAMQQRVKSRLEDNILYTRMFINKHSLGLCKISTFKLTSRLSNHFYKDMSLYGN